jgi:hypothetical protein
MLEIKRLYRYLDCSGVKRSVHKYTWPEKLKEELIDDGDITSFFFLVDYYALEYTRGSHQS